MALPPNPQQQAAPQAQGFNTSEGADMGKVAQAEELADKAMDILVEDTKAFQGMMTMFEKMGEQGFAQAVSNVVNGMLERLETDAGQPIDEEILAATGLKIIIMVIEDVEKAGFFPITEEMIDVATKKTLSDWMAKNPDRVDVPGQQQPQQQQVADQGQPAPPQSTYMGV